jgi:hypothetical protein
MAAGLPILFSGSGEGAKIVAGKRVGFVNKPGDYKELSENILKLRNTPGVLAEMSANCVKPQQRVNLIEIKLYLNLQTNLNRL